MTFERIFRTQFPLDDTILHLIQLTNEQLRPSTYIVNIVLWKFRVITVLRAFITKRRTFQFDFRPLNFDLDQMQ